jgi:hypothetical protein
MPGKSRRKRGRQPQSRKIKDRQRQVGSRVSAAVISPGPVSQSSATSPVVETPRPTVSPSPIQHPYITAELRTIGILTVIILGILFVLYAVLT